MYLLKPEEIEARKLKHYLDLLVSSKKVQVYSHVSNETFTKSWRQKSRNKAQGVKSGVPDYIIVTQNNVLFLELKREKGGVLSPTQKTWLQVLPDKTTLATVCHGFEECKTYLDTILIGKERL